MNHSAVTRFVLTLSVSLFLAASLSAQAVPDRDVSQIRINGLRTIPPRLVRRQLACLPEIVEASHSSLDIGTYSNRVREAVSRGMLASGFLDSRVELSDESGSLTLTIEEGPRFHHGSITVHGASDETNDWIRSLLLIESVDIDDGAPPWEPDTPADGTPLRKLHWTRNIQQRLDEMGLQGDGVVVDLVRNDETKTLDLSLDLSSTDSSFGIPVQGDSNDADPRRNDHASGNPTLVHRVRGELQQIHRRLFASPMSGIRVRDSQDNGASEYIFGPAMAIATIEHESTRRRFVLERGEILIAMDDPPAAIRLPVPNALVVLYLLSTEESDGKTARLSISGTLSTDKSERPTRTGVAFTPQVWAEWFPPDSTERSEDEIGVTYSHESHRLKLDHQGHFVELSGTGSNGNQISLNRIEEDEIRKIADEISHRADPLELFVRDQETGHQTSLAELFHVFFNNSENDVDFHIPPAGGESDCYGVIVLKLMHEGAFGDVHSLPARLARLCALEISGNRRGLRDRLAEIDPSVLKGPLTSFVVAELLIRQRNYERALNVLRHAQQLVGDSEAVQHDIGLLLDTNNLLGHVCEQVDLKRWIQQSAFLAAPFAEEHLVACIQDLAHCLPDASTNQERCDNAEVLLTVAYDLVGQELLEYCLETTIQAIESNPQEIAAQRVSDEKKR